MKKKVLILMSTYNGEEFLKEQIESIIKQKGNFELDILVRDDGSTDLTKELLDDYYKDGVLKWYSGENFRPAKSFMDLVFNCSTEYDYYAFSDQDDVWSYNKIQTAIDKLDSDKIAIYYSNPELVNKELKPIGRKVYRTVPHHDIYTTVCGASIIGCTMVFTKRLLDVLKKGNPPKVITMHDSYVARVCVLVGGTIIYDDNSYMKYRQHDKNVLGIKSKPNEKIKKILYDIFTKSQVTIDEQAKEILRIYGNYISNDKKEWLKKVINYRKNLFTRISLACCHKTKYITVSISLKNRLSILLGNR